MNAACKRAVLPALTAGALALLIGAAGAQERQFVPSPLKLFGKALDGMREAKPAVPARKPAAERKPARQAPQQAAPGSPRLPKPRPHAEISADEELAAVAATAADPFGPQFEVAGPQPLDEGAIATLPAADLASLSPAPPALPVPAGIEREWEETGFTPAPPEDVEIAASRPAEPSSASAVEALDALARTPRARPDAPSPLLAMVDPRGEVEPPVAHPPAVIVAEPEDPACLDRLRALGVRFTQSAAVGEGACRVAHPLSVTSVGSAIAIEPEAIMNCATAEALALWTRDSVVPSARETLKARPTKFAHGSTYVCRSRYNAPGEKMSEHAIATAVDIMSIGFADRDPVAVGASGANSQERAFEAAIREGSCAYFTTVLGPGSNAAHATHFHLDLAKRRGGYRLCELGDGRTAGAAAKTKRE